MAVVGRLLVVHRLLHGENAALRAAGVVGDVSPTALQRYPAAETREPSAASPLSWWLSLLALAMAKLCVRRRNELAVQLQGWQVVVRALGIEFSEHRLRPVGARRVVEALLDADFAAADFVAWVGFLAEVDFE